MKKNTFLSFICLVAIPRLSDNSLKYYAFFTILLLLPFAANAQTPTCFITQHTSTPTYIYVGSMTKSISDGSNLQKLKVDAFGGSWGSNTDGQTTFYIGNRGGLIINKVTTGSDAIDGYLSLQAYQNDVQTDFYLVAPANIYTGVLVSSLWLRDGTSVVVTPTSSTTTPTGTAITPLNITTVMTTDVAGNIGINTASTSPQYKLAVNGAFIATSATVKLYSNWPDYVFNKNYQLPSLQEVKTYINQNQHLPEVPSEQQIAKDGLNLGEMNKLLMKKMEEMTLYMIEAKEEINDLKKQVQDLKKQIK
ncbi:hypothetical protein G7092_21340 [Mucilaginibacter sp. HC2]|uniref:hypothetical protein n=1 Tax=Mucilaginibacter inviolabilis TaxID=2714892 RepID=UPI00140AED2B|nr:hypothetical protein [Mucilaginibacter inviolabilis]NHA06368.1 hypothetical protein [Mucilaginibacter inviolabilis]